MNINILFLKLSKYSQDKLDQVNSFKTQMILNLKFPFIKNFKLGKKGSQNDACTTQFTQKVAFKAYIEAKKK